MSTEKATAETISEKILSDAPKKDRGNNDGTMIVFKNLIDWIQQHRSYNFSSTVANSASVQGNVLMQKEVEVGYIHPSLAIASNNDRDGNDEESSLEQQEFENREIVTTKFIKKGELLVRLPSHFVLSGKDKPSHYSVKFASPEDDDAGNAIDKNIETTITTKKMKRGASPWLRCLAALIESLHCHATSSNSIEKNSSSPAFFEPYLKSLPSEFDTLTTSWSTNEIQNYLRGTALGKLALADRQCQTSITTTTSTETNYNGGNAMRDRYEKLIKPYLNHVGIDTKTTKNLTRQHCELSCEQQSPEESNTVNDSNDCVDDDDDGYKMFLYASACLSTRGFHLRQEEEEMDDKNKEAYNGPYLLPFIDLLNHSSPTTKDHPKCTTLQRDSKAKTFYMVAERDIQPDESIRHSYGSGNNFNSAQLLQTFGFVDNEAMIRAALSSIPKEENNRRVNITSASLKRDDVVKACRDIAASDYPQKLRQHMEDRHQQSSSQYEEEEEEEEEEISWDIPSPALLDQRNDILNKIIPCDILINNQQDPLNNEELVTACVMQFLPTDVYNEYCQETTCDDTSSSFSLLDKSALEDYFLGKLVTKSILLIVERAGRAYLPPPTSKGDHNKNTKKERPTDQSKKIIDDSSAEKMELFSYFGSMKNDQVLLHRLLQKDGIVPMCQKTKNSTAANKDVHSTANMTTVRRQMYGLTISLEERSCLWTLREEVLRFIDFLDNDSNIDEIKG